MFFYEISKTYIVLVIANKILTVKLSLVDSIVLNNIFIPSNNNRIGSSAYMKREKVDE